MRASTGRGDGVGWLGPATTAARLGARRAASEPGGLVFAAVFYLMVTAVLAGMWRTAAEAGGGGGIVGYSAVALVWYIAASEAAVLALPQRLIEDVGIEIDDGLEAELLRPTPLIVVRLAAEVGRMLPRLGVCLAVGVVLARIIGGPIPDPVALTIAVPSLLLAATVNLAAQYAFAGAAFWLRDVRSAWFLYQKLVFVLGGMLLPLEVLPRWLELTAKALPFAAMAYAPARLASGSVEPELLAIQVGWLALAVAGALAVYRAGERRQIRTGA
ncbi:MAG: ABC-2 family transporter protein [Actinomycetota bacterium]